MEGVAQGAFQGLVHGVPRKFRRGSWAFAPILASVLTVARFGTKSAGFDCHKTREKIARGPFQSASALVHTARTQGLRPRVAFSGSLRTEPAPKGVGQAVFRFLS